MRIGFVNFGTRNSWRFAWVMRRDGWCGIFRNLPHIKPGRWGFYVLGFELGSRNPGNRIGLLLRRLRLWPW